MRVKLCERKFLKLVGLVEYGIETSMKVTALIPAKRDDMRDIREALEWLKRNLDYIFADAEYDERL